ncbi:ATP-binding protein [Streptomyces sp. NPDC057438]|uniref:ATP-binding protein n=1 Tax=Streptomyces sp. NPDC057438 TaxID=3346133 RepID=UPI0036B6C42A
MPHGTAASDAAVLIVAELSVNAVFHGRVPGRDFALRLVHEPAAALLRVEVSDTHPALPDPWTRPPTPTGRRLILVEALDSRWFDRPHPTRAIILMPAQ